jgi:hypothetical protein
MSEFSKLHKADQGVFNTVKGISSIPTINLALISNTKSREKSLLLYYEQPNICIWHSQAGSLISNLEGYQMIKI